MAGAGATVVRPACPAAGLAAPLLCPPRVSPHVSTCTSTLVSRRVGREGSAAVEESTKLSCFVVVVGVGITRGRRRRLDGTGDGSDLEIGRAHV